MIHAFVQRLDPEKQYLLVRAGPLAKEYGDRYRKSCLGEIDGESVTLMAFCEPWWIQFLRRWFPRLVGSLTPYVKASIRALYADGFKKVHLDRLTANPRRLVFTQGDEEGKITMSRKDFPKASAHAVHTGRDGGNKIDQKAALDQIDGLVKAGRGGAAEIVHLETTELATAGKKRRVRAVVELELPA